MATEEAERLFEEGFTLIPLGSPSETPPSWHIARCESVEDAREKWPKTPRVKWSDFQRTPPSDELFETWCRKWPQANWAILTGPQVVVVDADSADAIAFLESGELTRSPRKVITAKGAHFYYQSDPDVPIRNSANPNSKIDIRGHGGYVVAPGSVHYTGVLYTEEVLEGWGDVTPIGLPRLTSQDLQRIHEFNGTEVQSNGALNFNGPGNLAFDATQVKMPATGAPVAPGGRNNAAASLAGQHIQAGRSLAETKRLLDAWNETNPVPLPDPELNTTIASVAQTHANKGGTPVPLVPHVPTPLELIDASELVAIVPEPIEWVWNDWLAKRTTAGLFAEGGTGKSLFALQLAICMAAQVPFVDGNIPPPGTSLLVFCEDEPNIVNIRMRRMLKELHVKPETLRGAVKILCRVGQDNYLVAFDKQTPRLTPFWEDLEKTIEQVRPDLLVVDTALDTFGGNSIDNQQVGAYIQRGLTSLATQHNLAAMFLAHVSVQGKSSGSGLSGANAWRDKARAQIYMAKETPEAVEIKVTRMKSNYSQAGVELTIYNNAGFLQQQAEIDLTSQVDDVAKMDFMTLMRRFEEQETKVSPSLNSPYYAPKLFAKYAETNPRKIKTTDRTKYERAYFQLLEEGLLVVQEDTRKGTKTLHLQRLEGEK